MLDAAAKALSQILSPPMRSILWRSIGLALVLIMVLAIGLQRLLSWFATYGEGWAEAMLGPGSHTPLNALAWVVSIAAALGVVLGGIFLMPAVTSLVAGFFVDDVGDLVEREYYPAEQPGVALPLSVATIEGVKIALLTILVYLVALPFVLVAGAGFLIFFIATAWLLGRAIFRARGDALPRRRRRPRRCASTMRRPSSPRGCSSRPSSRSRSSTWRRRCSAWPSWSTCTSDCRGPRPELIEPSRRTSVPTV